MSEQERKILMHVGPQEGPMGMEDLMAVMPMSKVPALQENVEQLGRYLAQMGQLITAMQRRMDEMEARQEKITVSHRDVLQVMARIRWKARETCMKYNLQDAQSVKIFRAAIRKDVLRRAQVKDLHDLPAASLPAAEKQIDSWTDIRLIMDRRVST